MKGFSQLRWSQTQALYDESVIITQILFDDGAEITHVTVKHQTEQKRQLLE